MASKTTKPASKQSKPAVKKAAPKQPASRITVSELAKQCKASPRKVRRIARTVVGTGTRGTPRSFTKQQATKVQAALSA